MICTTEDDFVKQRAHWVVELRSGLKVYQDDGRPEVNPPSAWIRLGKYITETGDYIEHMYLQFYSHIVKTIPSGAAAYFFCNSAVAVSYFPITFNFYLIGHLANDKIVVQRWLLPDLKFTGVKGRSINEVEQLCLIRRQS